MDIEADVRNALDTLAQFGTVPFFRARDIVKICRDVGRYYSDLEVGDALDRSPLVEPGYMEWWFTSDESETRVRIYRLKRA